MTRVLLIEDDLPFRQALASALGKRGCLVRQAAGVSPAEMEEARTLGVDGIVLDMRLGATDGMALIPALRGHFPQARLVVLTGYGSIPSAIEAVRRGADDYFLKPVNADHLLAALRGQQTSAARPAAGDSPSLARLEWEHIQRVLQQCQGNISHAAEALGIDRRTLQRKLFKMPPKM